MARIEGHLSSYHRKWIFSLSFTNDAMRIFSFRTRLLFYIWLQIRSDLVFLLLLAGMCSCFCLFQDTLCCSYRITDPSVLKSHVVGHWFGSRTSWCLLVESMDTVWSTLVSPYCSPDCYTCFYVCVYWPSHFCARIITSRQIAAEVSCFQRHTEEVSIHNTFLALVCIFSRFCSF